VLTKYLADSSSSGYSVLASVILANKIFICRY